MELGELLLPAYNTPLGIAVPEIYLPHDEQAAQGVHSSMSVVIAGAGSAAMEMSTLSHLTGELANTSFRRSWGPSASEGVELVGGCRVRPTTHQGGPNLACVAACHLHMQLSVHAVECACI